MPFGAGQLSSASGVLARRSVRRAQTQIGRYGRVVVLGRSVFKREELPLAWDSLKLLRSAARQYNAGSDKGVANGLADEDLVSLCEPNYAGGDVHRDTREVVSMIFDFAQV